MKMKTRVSAILMTFVMALTLVLSNGQVSAAATVISTIDLHNIDLGFNLDEEVLFLSETDDADKVEIVAEWWTDPTGKEVASIDHQTGETTGFTPSYGVYYYGVRFDAKDGYEFSEDTRVCEDGDELSPENMQVKVVAGNKTIIFDNILKLTLSSSSESRKIDVSSIKLSKDQFVYDGKAHKPTVSAKMEDGGSVDGFMTIDYSDSKPVDVGFYTIFLRPDNTAVFSDGENLKYLLFYIVPKATSIKSLAASKKSLTVKWKKQATQTTGYIVQLSKDKSFKKIAKTKTIKKNSTTSVKFTGLKSKTKYYARVCAYKQEGSAQIQSGWSSVKNKKVK